MKTQNTKHKILFSFIDSHSKHETKTVIVIRRRPFLKLATTPLTLVIHANQSP